jgi:arylsulfatase
MAGKWHLGTFGKEKWPLQRGFDRYYGIISGGTNYFNPQPPRGLTLGNEDVQPGEDFYLTDAFTDYAIDFVNEAVEKKDKPFFLYLAYTSPHWPLHAPAEDVNKYRGKYMKGWEKLRAERLTRMIKMGLIDPDWELAPQDSRDWESLSEEKKTELDLRMSIYAAQIDRMDQNIGRVISTLESTNQLDNTIIIFLSDNGGCAEGGELGGGKKEDLESDRGWVLSYGRAWANASNTPFKRYKHWVHEGGISTPFIVHWPDGISKKSHGTFINQFAFLPDIMATVIDISKADYPKEYNGNKIPPMVGKSFLNTLNNKDVVIHKEPIFFEHEGNRAVRSGKYKLVSAYNYEGEQKWELYDMKADRTEMNDLSEQMPEKVKDMSAQYNEWAANNLVVPWKKIYEITKSKKKK